VPRAKQQIREIFHSGGLKREAFFNRRTPAFKLNFRGKSHFYKIFSIFLKNPLAFSNFGVIL
jgi:hypothetical protein